jgi:hypothetical protein
MVHLNTPPKATSSPKTTAFLSLSKAIDKESLIDWKRFNLVVSFDFNANSGLFKACSLVCFKYFDSERPSMKPLAGGGDPALVAKLLPIRTLTNRIIYLMKKKLDLVMCLYL